MNNRFLNTRLAKSVTILLLISFACINSLFAQFLVNNGATITVTNGSVLTLKAGMTNLTDGHIVNSGDIIVMGDWSNDGTSGDFMQGSSGVVTFKGQSGQLVGGLNTTGFSTLNFQNDATLTNDIFVSNELVFSTGIINLDTNNLLLESGAIISGSSAVGYVNAENSGKLFIETGVEDVEFPVGTSLAFTPVALSNLGTTDIFGVNIFNDVLDGGLTGNTISEISHCVNNTWNISEETTGGSNLTITPSWDASLEGTGFDRQHCGIGHYTSGNWQPQTEMPATGSNPYSISISGITELSAFAVGDTVSPMSITLRLHLDLTVLLEGPFNGIEMNTLLNDSGFIPLQQPYNVSPWSYQGTESVQEIPNGNIVDWILVELRDAPDSAQATSSTMIARQAAFLLKDGSIVSLDGSSNLTFNNYSINDNLYVVIWHRNHLGIMSSNALIEDQGVYTYNFTTSDSQVYGTDGQKQIGSGIWGMYAGDGNGDNSVDSLDISLWKQEAGKAGYNKTDFNLDGQSDNSDKDDLWIENKDVTSEVPQ